MDVGNSDAGAMQTWFLWNFIGLYPVTGRNAFLIHSPWQSMTIDLEDGKKLEIVVEGGNSDDAFYVQSLRINGEDWKKNWLTWDDVFMYGATMEYVLGAEASDWFNGGELPPSLAW
jgi:putative alpha-1,2-mannosidase